MKELHATLAIAAALAGNRWNYTVELGWSFEFVHRQEERKMFELP